MSMLIFFKNVKLINLNEFNFQVNFLNILYLYTFKVSFGFGYEELYIEKQRK